jgi:uncharacterized delta-60 repeat protein
LPDGSPDTSFGHSGVVRTYLDWASGADAVAIDANGRIVVAGFAQAHRSSTSFALARYLPDGALDPTFGRDGVVKTPVVGLGGATAMAFDSRGRIVAAGNGYSTFTVARYRPNGRLDPSFGGDGSVAMGRADGAFANSVAIDAKDRIVAAGTNRGESGRARGDFMLARYFGDGPTVTISGPARVRTAHRKARATFSFEADEQASFECKVGRTAFQPCTSPYATRRLRLGRHRLEVRATDALGSRDVTTKRFKVVQTP